MTPFVMFLVFMTGLSAGVCAVLIVALIMYRNYGDDEEPVELPPGEPERPSSGVKLTPTNGTHKRSVGILYREG